MNPVQTIHVAPTTERKTQPGHFAAALQGAAGSLVRGVAASAALAAPFVPGGTVLSGAVRNVAASLSSRAGPRPSGDAAVLSGAATPSPGGAGEGDILQATRALQQDAQTFNLQYLQLQENMQRESRAFTAISNVMKVKHDSAKSAINNIH